MSKETRIRSSKGNIFVRRAHIPSGIIIVWLGDNNLIHTRSVPCDNNVDPELARKLTLLHAKTELLLRQLDLMCIDGIKSEPMMCFGLTRLQAKQALTKELQQKRECEEWAFPESKESLQCHTVKELMSKKSLSC